MSKTNAVWLQNNARGGDILAQIQASLEGTSTEVLAIRDEVNAQRAVNADIVATVNRLSHEITAAAINGVGANDRGAHALQAQKKALVDWARSGGKVTAGMTTDVDPSAGYLVPDELDRMIHALVTNRSPMRQLANVVRTRTANYSKLVRTSGAEARWANGETSSVDETDSPTYSQVNPPLGEIVAEPRISQTLLDDSAFDAAAEIMSAIADGVAGLEGAAFVSGNGVGRPRGFLTHTIVSTSDATRPFGHIQYKPSGVAAALSDASNNGADSLISLVYSLQSNYRTNAAFTMNSTTAGVVRKYKDSEGRHLWQESLADATPSRLMGYPVYTDEYMPDVGAGTYPIAFADWSAAYTITDRTDMRLLLDPYTSKPWVKFYVTKRVGGHMIDSKAIKLLKVAAS